MKKNIAKAVLMALLMIPLGIALPAIAAAPPSWNTTGSYVVDFNYLGPNYSHDMILTQDGLGNLTGSGGSPSGSNVYTWVIISGSVSGSSIDFLANYTATPDAVTPLTTMHVVGTVAPGGTMSGTWTDNYAGGSRSGTWATTSGIAIPLGSLAAEDFGVVDYNTGLGQLRGYSAGFGLTNAVFTDATSVVVKLYGAGDVLLQTNTFNPANIPLITGNQISSPFDVSGTFDYVTDGYWTNVRETQYGQSVPAVKVVATVTLANGKVVTAENTTLAGDPTTIYPLVTPPGHDGDKDHHDDGNVNEDEHADEDQHDGNVSNEDSHGDEDRHNENHNDDRNNDQRSNDHGNNHQENRSHGRDR